MTGSSDRRSTALKFEVTDVADIHQARERIAAYAARGDGHVPADELKVVASELITNALSHGGGTARIRVQVRRGSVSMLVADAVTVRPEQPEMSTEAVGGRGLLICEALASELRVKVGPAGKAIRALFNMVT